MPLISLIVRVDQGCADGGTWGRHTPQYFQICKKVGQKLARGLATVFSLTNFFLFSNNLVKVVGQLVRKPSQQKVSRHITGVD